MKNEGILETLVLIQLLYFLLPINGQFYLFISLLDKYLY
jgi:hypothetical protein